ncbi:GPI inositol-deacylase [Ophiocordyceps camponoti-floridani]|uniref:GPI inositol-deacylase n=1 Tax=Ophiocordyceps camponoti-floridani TaxID=2030778 RepID=A0A8H4VEY8_9HYPO|nr:GPI inositol-deacylase [Ophiocordyceps camponoti-floridani]
MSYMRPSYVHLTDFGNEHTRFATKYSLYLYREQGIDDEQLRGIPVLFIPGNAGSYKQVRPIAAEAASYHHNILLDRRNSMQPGVRNLDFFTVDFNEDITAFHGQTLLDQAEYLNEAVRYILSLYSDPQRAGRDDEIPDPSAVVILVHRVVLFLVSTVIPYQFAYVVACLVQMFTVICAFRTNTKLASVDSQNFYHYAHSILLLMMWVLPINLPILAVWARNLAVHWLTPFPSHHNVFCIIPFMLLVENLTAGSMVPQMRSWHRHVTNLLLVGTAFCVALYGVSHAYALHYLVNAVAAWLVYLHSTKHA